MQKLTVVSREQVAAPPVAFTHRDVVRQYRARVTPHLSMLMKRSAAVATQFLPDGREMVEYGGTDAPFEEGKLNHGIYGLERIYADRAVITPYFDCSAYCRYCFKKTRTLAGDSRRMTDDDLARAIEYIRGDPRIRTALVTGGDPLLDLPLLKKVLDELIKIPHVSFIRIGTRNILFQPEQITQDVADWLASYNRVDLSDVRRSKNLSVGFSLNHADEISSEVARAAQMLIRRGITIRGQVTLLRGINDEPRALRDLYEVFGAIGIVAYYLLHCMPVVGAMHFRTSVQRGLDILRELSPLTGAIAPTYVYVTPIGKHRMGITHSLEYADVEGRPHIRATTPYLATDFLEYTGKTELPPLHWANDRGYVVSHYLDGDD